MKNPAAPLPLSSLFHLHFNFWSCQAQLLNISPAKARLCSGPDSCSTEQPQREVIPHNPWSPYHEAPPDAPGGVSAQGGKAGALGEQSGTPSLGTSRFSADTWTRAMPPLTHSRGSNRQAAIQIQFLGIWKARAPTHTAPSSAASRLPEIRLNLPCREFSAASDQGPCKGLGNKRPSSTPDGQEIQPEHPPIPGSAECCLCLQTGMIDQTQLEVMVKII